MNNIILICFFMFNLLSYFLIIVISGKLLEADNIHEDIIFFLAFLCCVFLSLCDLFFMLRLMK